MPERIRTENRRKTVSDGRWALSAFYAANFGHMGVMLPFFAPWLQARGVGALGIGLMLAAPPLAKVAAPWLWGRWADRTGRRGPLLIIASVLAAGALVGMTIPSGLPWLAVLVGLYGFARAPIIPYLEATALEQSEAHGFSYGPVRLWGSVSFMLVSSVYGAMRTSLPIDAGLWLAAGLLGTCAVLAAWALPGPERLGFDVAPRPTAGRAGKTHAAGPLRLLAACGLMQASHGAYYTFYSIHLGQLGYSSASIGALWAIGVLAEIALLSRADRLLRRFGPTTMMRASLTLAVVRWVVIADAESPAILVAAQALHAATYAGFHVAAVREVYRLFGVEHRARGQALYSGMTFGLGMFVGSLAAGWLAGTAGIPAAFTVSAIVALAALPVLGRSGRTDALPTHGPAGATSARRQG